jgi:hypothetical protein
MSKPAMKGYLAEFKVRGATRGVKSVQSMAQTVRDLGCMKTRSDLHWAISPGDMSGKAG